LDEPAWAGSFFCADSHSTAVIARSEATWQSVPQGADCHTILRMVRNDMGIYTPYVWNWRVTLIRHGFAVPPSPQGRSLRGKIWKLGARGDVGIAPYMV
jgi:hypothetical protein